MRRSRADCRAAARPAWSRVETAHAARRSRYRPALRPAWEDQDSNNPGVNANYANLVHNDLNDNSGRVRSVAECPDQGPLTEPAADAPPRGWGLFFMPQSGPSAAPLGLAQEGRNRSSDQASILAQTGREQSCRCEALLRRHANGSV